ncbi:hypothetical protein QFC20_002681 [Naganishia adeliensis]|uniref:Uncharacterized protein n=1 Tax=Naganishia adeliensis TaxID=92952 RepID=A0ACC2WHU2_9TREE|nr:hypothetical protein QFC20_002681 [Naganishia adeliensis]
MIELIAHNLVDKDLYRTCANLDSVCKAFKEVVDPILWMKVLFRRSNVAKGKKSGERWRAVFKSEGARYIQFLTIIYLNKLDVNLDYKSVNIPLLTTLVSRENRLKACIVPGKGVQHIGIYLFKRYIPCSAALFAIMGLVEAAPLITKGYYIESNNGDFTPMLVQAFNQLPASGGWSFPPFLGGGLVLIAEARLPIAYTKRLVADVVALFREVCTSYCDDTKNAGGRILSPMSLRPDIWGASIDEAMMFGECLKVAHHLDKAFAASVYRIRMAEPLAPAKAKSVTRLLERAYLPTHTKFKKQPPGGPYIIDVSAESNLRKPQPTEITINPFGSVEEVHGVLQYLPMGEVVRCFRANGPA